MAQTKLPADLTEAEALEELTALADEIAAHDIRYHRDDAPLISDADYDALKRRNSEIEARFPHLVRENSPSLSVGAARAEQFAPVEHGVPMLSLDNAFSDADAIEFDTRVRRFLRLDETLVAYTAEPKIDGLSCSIRYEHGVLVQAATRGDGRVGEDVTANVRTIGEIPARLSGGGWPDVVEIRGEIYLGKAEYIAMNAAAEAAELVCLDKGLEEAFAGREVSRDALDDGRGRGGRSFGRQIRIVAVVAHDEHVVGSVSRELFDDVLAEEAGASEEEDRRGHVL